MGLPPFQVKFPGHALLPITGVSFCKLTGAFTSVVPTPFIVAKIQTHKYLN